MGYIPIVIALLAFALLFVLVNLNGLQARQQSLGLAFFNLCQTAKARNAMLRRIRGVRNNEVCPELPSQPQHVLKNMPKYLNFIEVERISLADSDYFLKDHLPTADTQRYTTALKVLNHRQQINLKIFERKVREYNQLLQRNPTSFVATLYRLKPVKLISARK